MKRYNLLGMKRYEKSLLLAFVMSILTGAAISQEIGPELEDPNITGVNILKPHAWFVPFPNSKSVYNKNNMESPWCMLLNGEWKFFWSENPAPS